MAVGGSSDRRGVISTSNYLARKFGVKSAMPTGLAMKLCPQLILVNGSMRKYKEASDIVFDVILEYSDLVQSVSIDEAYLDVTDCPLFHNSATLIAEDIRKKIFERTNGLTASAGIAPNKLIAKLASDFNKPNGKFTVAPHQVDDFIRKIRVERIPGIGKVTASRLHEIGLKTCLDLQKHSRSDMIHLLGKFGNTLYDYCRGIDERDVETEYERKSLGTESTFAKDISDFEEMKVHILKMVAEVKEDLKHYEDRIVKNLHVKIKYLDFKQTTIERKLPFSEESFLELLEERWAQDPRAVRLLGVGVKFEEEEKEQRTSLMQLPLLTEESA